jgi:hypothetical protein
MLLQPVKVCALGPEPVRACEPPVEVTEVGRARERRHLVDDRVRLGAGHGLPDADGVKSIDDDRVGAEPPDLLG